jgi:hypothetical protein
MRRTSQSTVAALMGIGETFDHLLSSPQQELEQKGEEVCLVHHLPGPLPTDLQQV